MKKIALEGSDINFDVTHNYYECSFKTILFRLLSKCEKVHILFFCMFLTVPIPAHSTIIKILHIKNPTNTIAKDMHVTHSTKVKGVRGASKGKEGQPSDTFEGVSFDGKKADFVSGSLGAKKTDNYRVELDGKLKSAVANNVVTKVEFTDGNGDVFHTLDKSTKKKKKEFKLNVTGFTNEEYFDLDNRNDAWYHLLNTDASLNIQYTLSDFQIWKNLPLADFNINNDFFNNLSSGIKVYETSSLVLNPGESFDMSLGALSDNSYAMAMIGTITVKDLDTNETSIFVVPQVHAEDGVPAVPVPAAVWLFGTGLLCLIGTARNNREQCQS